MLIARIMEDGGLVTECMAGSGQVYVLPLNSFSYSCQLRPFGFNSDISPTKPSSVFQETGEGYGEKSREESHVPRKGKEKRV